jgi:hypothetical protein
MIDPIDSVIDISPLPLTIGTEISGVADEPLWSEP